MASDGRTVAVRLDNGTLALIGKPADKFAAAAWLRRAGDGRTPEQAIGGPGIRCDASGCLARLRGTLIAVDYRIAALAEDCDNASLLISTVPADIRCHGRKLVIDRRDAWRRRSLRRSVAAYRPGPE